MIKPIPDSPPLRHLDTLVNPQATLRRRLIVACQASLQCYGTPDEWGVWASKCGASYANIFMHRESVEFLDVQVCVAVTDKLILIAWRGTPAHSLSAWVQNLDPTRRMVLGGKIHAGFHSEFESVAGDLWRALQPYLKADRQIVFVGHSKGGALSNVAAFVRRRVCLRVDAVYTFGAPRSLGWDAAKWLDTELQTNVRCVHSNDPVPLLPGLGLINRLRYRHAGQLTLLTEAGKLIPDPTWRQRVGEWVRGYELDAITDHFGGEYADALVSYGADARRAA